MCVCVCVCACAFRCALVSVFGNLARNSAEKLIELYTVDNDVMIYDIMSSKFPVTQKDGKVPCLLPTWPIHPKRFLGCDRSSGSVYFFQDTAGVLHPVVVASAPHQHS